MFFQFQDENDLKLLIDNSELMKKLDLPFCTSLKLSNKLLTLDKGTCSNLKWMSFILLGLKKCNE